MAPNCPEEVDVFTVPHSRMKELVQNYLDMITSTNFSDVLHLKSLLRNLSQTFREFKAHEQIENQFIMRKLKKKMKSLSISNPAVCNCHNDNRLVEMMLLFKDGYRCTKKTEADRQNFGTKLRRELKSFTEQFLPHMEEEEEVFQPMLVKYFSYEELCLLKHDVLKRHFIGETEEKYVSDTLASESSDEEDGENTRTGFEHVPNELMMKIFSFLGPRDLCRSAQACRRWNNLAMDSSLWHDIYPTQWTQGDWSFKLADAREDDEGTKEDVYIVIDEDADIDESESIDSDTIDSDPPEAKQIQKEAHLLTSMVKYLLPRIGKSVKKCSLANSRGLCNGVLYKFLSHCCNLEYLDLSQTKISDLAFKGVGTNGCGERLTHVNLSGCDNITDVTLERLSYALHGTGEPIGRSSGKRQTSNGCTSLHSTGSGHDPKHGNISAKNAGSSSGHINRKKECHEIFDHEKDVCEVKVFHAYASTISLECKQRDVRTFSFSAALDFEGRSFGRFPLRTLGGCLSQGYPPSMAGSSPIYKCQRKFIAKNGCTRSNHLDVCHSACTNTKENRCSATCQRRKDDDHGFSDVGKPCKLKTVTYKDIAASAKDSSLSAEVLLPCCDRVNYSDRYADKLGPNHSCDERDFPKSGGLVFLSLSGCYLVTDSGLKCLSEDGGLPALRHLDLSGCLNVTAEGLTRLVDACPHLHDAELFYCDNIVDGPFAATANGCQNLECRSRMCCRKGH